MRSTRILAGQLWLLRTNMRYAEPRGLRSRMPSIAKRLCLHSRIRTEKWQMRILVQLQLRSEYLKWLRFHIVGISVIHFCNLHLLSSRFRITHLIVLKCMSN